MICQRPPTPGGGWREVMLAAALQGAIFAAVKAALDRAARGHA